MRFLSPSAQSAEVILDALPAAFVRLDREFRHSFVNRHAEQESAAEFDYDDQSNELRLADTH